MVSIWVENVQNKVMYYSMHITKITVYIRLQSFRWKLYLGEKIILLCCRFQNVTGVLEDGIYFFWSGCVSYCTRLETTFFTIFPKDVPKHTSVRRQTNRRGRWCLFAAIPQHFYHIYHLILFSFCRQC